MKIIKRKPSSPSWQVAYARDHDKRLVWKGTPMKSRISCQIELRSAPPGLWAYGIYRITQNPEQFPDSCFTETLA